VLKTYTGSWHMVFVVAAIMNFVVVALALFVLRPLRMSAKAAEPLVGHPAAE
jgi:OFA family oxalate/formate antiporter-like MFS transporter